MKSLHELRTELTGVRLSAQNHSLWALGAEVNERARLSLNDAVSQYKFRVTEQWTSLQLDIDGIVVVLPETVNRIIGIYSVTDSGYGRSHLSRYRHVPTPMTNLLYLDDLVKVYDGTTEIQRVVEVEYETRLKAFPKDLAINATLTTAEVGYIDITGGSPKSTYVSPGYIELTPTSDTDIREVIRYELALPTGFTNLTREVKGVRRIWSGDTRVSCVAPIPQESVPVIMAAAKASMYEFWVTHQALYTQWITAAGIRDMTVEDLQGLIRTEEDRASRRYDKTRGVPRPTTFRRRRKPF